MDTKWSGDTCMHTRMDTHTHTHTLMHIDTHAHKRAAGINKKAKPDASAAVYPALLDASSHLSL